MKPGMRLTARSPEREDGENQGKGVGKSYVGRKGPMGKESVGGIVDENFQKKKKKTGSNR